MRPSASASSMSMSSWLSHCWCCSRLLLGVIRRLPLRIEAAELMMLEQNWQDLNSWGVPSVQRGGEPV
jgi:hypothetical protein